MIGHPRLQLLPDHCGVSLKPKPTFSLSLTLTAPPLQYCHTSSFSLWHGFTKICGVCVSWMCSSGYLCVCVTISLCGHWGLAATALWTTRLNSSSVGLFWMSGLLEYFDDSVPPALLPQTPIWWDFVPDKPNKKNCHWWWFPAVLLVRESVKYCEFVKAVFWGDLTNCWM